MSRFADRRARFRALHQSGCFAIPNPWDGGSAQRLAKAGFEALASTSAGAAWALGRADGDMTLDEVLEHAKVSVRRVSVGGTLARATYEAFDGFAQPLASEGRLP